MNILRLQTENFRNLILSGMEVCENVNVIHGENAQGKTNVIESIWMFTGCRSFRGAKDCELIRLGEESASATLDFYAAGREQQAKITFQDRKKTTLNGVQLGSASELAGEFLAVVFAPIHLNLVKGSPSERRKFLDMALCQLRPRYAALLTQYNRALAQRNMLLKDIVRHSELYGTLDIWDDRLASFGAAIIHMRLSYIRGLREAALPIYDGISGGRECLQISYEYSAPLEEGSRDEVKRQLLTALRKTWKEDMTTGSTATGPHRDDLKIEIDGLSSKIYASQGQQRSAALALKLSEAKLITRVTNEQPVILLDDVMSELDGARQEYILNYIGSGQVFITCCDPGSLLRMRGGKAFKIQGGRLVDT